MRFIIILSLLAVTGCSITPESISRQPQLNAASSAGVGDTIYVYDKRGKKFHDYMNGGVTRYSKDIRYELIYSGMSKGSLKLTYREYVNDMARSSFYQDAEYDYSPGMTATFKGAKVSVIEASGNAIKYKLLSGFSGEEVLPQKN